MVSFNSLLDLGWISSKEWIFKLVFQFSSLKKSYWFCFLRFGILVLAGDSCVDFMVFSRERER